MSGIEVIGLVLGVFGILEPLEKSCRALSGVCRKSASFEKFLKRTRRHLVIESHNFQEITNTLLRSTRFEPALTEQDLELLIEFVGKGLSDSRWQDREFQEQLSIHLKSYPNILCALSLVTDDFAEVSEIYGDLLLSMNTAGTMDDLDNNLDKMELKKAVKTRKLSPEQKIKLTMKEPDIEKLVGNIRVDIEIYRAAVGRFSTDQVGPLGYQKACISPQRSQDAHSAWEMLTSTFEMLHSSSIRLFSALQASGTCPCHVVSMRPNFEILLNRGRHEIRYPFPSDLTDLYTKFDLLAIVDRQNVSKRVTCVDLQSPCQDLLPLEAKMR